LSTGDPTGQTALRLKNKRLETVCGEPGKKIHKGLDT
jgi:hypothetical protein